jgi:hypothetical protein
MEKREDGRYVFPEGKYVMIKMPNRPLLSVYQVSFSPSLLRALLSLFLMFPFLIRFPTTRLRKRMAAMRTLAVMTTRVWTKLDCPFIICK